MGGGLLPTQPQKSLPQHLTALVSFDKYKPGQYSGHNVARLEVMALFLSAFYVLFICFLKTPTSTPAPWTARTRHRGSHAPFPETRRLCSAPKDTSQPNPIPKFFSGARDTRRSMAEPRESSQQYAIHFHTCYGSHGVSHTVTAHTKYLKPVPATF